VFHKLETGVGKSEIEITNSGRLGASQRTCQKRGCKRQDYIHQKRKKDSEALQSIAGRGWRNVKKTLEFITR
jgi:hypothetical protein